MKRSRNIRKHLIPVCMVLAFALLLGLTLNLYKPIRRLTQKKVVNPENLLQSDGSIIWETYIAKDGITYERNKDGSWHIYGTSTKETSCYLNLDSFSLTDGKTYMLSSGMKHAGANSYHLALKSSDGQFYAGDLEPEYSSKPAVRHYGAFEAKGGVTYRLNFLVQYAGAIIDEVVYPCLVEGTEPGDFYIYK